MVHIKNIFLLIRVKGWWRYKIPPALAASYLSINICEIPFSEAVFVLSMLIIWFSGAMGFAHILNDICDFDQDVQAGKKNAGQLISLPLRITVAFLFLAMAIFPWILIPYHPAVSSLAAFHLILCVAYSMPPVRLKEKKALGIVSCAMAEATLPMMIFVLTPVLFANGPEPASHIALFFLGLAWNILYGLHNIILHQLIDHPNDIRSNVKTFVTSLGVEKTNLLLKKIILPAEVLLFIILCLFLAHLGMYLFLIPAVITLAIAIILAVKNKNSRFAAFMKDFYTNEEQLIYNFLNSTYEGIMPFVSLYYLVIRSDEYWYLLPAHLILFNGFFLDLIAKITKLANKIFLKKSV